MSDAATWVIALLSVAGVVVLIVFVARSTAQDPPFDADPIAALARSYGWWTSAAPSATFPPALAARAEPLHCALAVQGPDFTAEWWVVRAGNLGSPVKPRFGQHVVRVGVSGVPRRAFVGSTPRVNLGAYATRSRDLTIFPKSFRKTVTTDMGTLVGGPDGGDVRRRLGALADQIQQSNSQLVLDGNDLYLTTVGHPDGADFLRRVQLARLIRDARG